MELSKYEISVLKRCISKLFMLRGWVIDSTIPCEEFLFNKRNENVIHIRRDYFYRTNQLNLIDRELKSLQKKWIANKEKYDSYIIEVISAELPRILLDENSDLYFKLKGNDIDIYFENSSKTQVFYTFKLD